MHKKKNGPNESSWCNFGGNWKHLIFMPSINVGYFGSWYNNFIKMRTSYKLLLLMALLGLISAQCPARPGLIASNGDCVCDTANGWANKADNLFECKCATTHALNFAGDACITNADCAAIDDGSDSDDVCICAAATMISGQTCVACPNGQHPAVGQGECVATCPDGQHLNSDHCIACNIARCKTCTDDVAVCTACMDGTTRMPATGAIQECAFDCEVEFCAVCSSTQGVCSSCQTGFFLTNGTCDYSAKCDANEFWNGAACVCQNGAGSDTCAVCTVANCLTCPDAVATCTSCIAGFYGATCATCGTGCLICQQASVCMACQPGYVIDNGDCSNALTWNAGRNAAVLTAGGVTCDPGCIKCDATTCTKAAVGYGINSDDNPFPCSTDNCATCSDADVCSACASGYRIDSEMCEECTKDNCMSCAAHRDVCSQCMPGYLLNTTTQECSVQCGDGCLSCGIAGEGRCDANCVAGYVFSNNACLKCLQDNCNCLANRLDQCDTCWAGYYKVNNTCVACNIAGCEQCSSATVCTVCADGFRNDNSNPLVCAAQCLSPCQDCTAATAGSCKADNDNGCLQGFGNDETAGACIIQCNTGNTCGAQTDCPYGYIFNTNKCDECVSTVPNCARCNTDTAKCVACSQGNYLANDTACVACPSACSACSTEHTCTACNLGYFLDNIANTCSPCDAACTNCTDSATSCSACATGNDLLAEISSCVPTVRVITNIVFQQDPDTIVPVLPAILIEIVTAAFNGTITDGSLFKVISITEGSTEIDGSLTIPEGESASEAASLLGTALTNGDINGPGNDLVVTSSSVTVNGSGGDDDDDNLALILGITIPVAIIIIAVIAFCIWKNTKGDGDKLKNEDSGQHVNVK